MCLFYVIAIIQLNKYVAMSYLRSTMWLKLNTIPQACVISPINIMCYARKIVAKKAIQNC